MTAGDAKKARAEAAAAAQLMDDEDEDGPGVADERRTAATANGAAPAGLAEASPVRCCSIMLQDTLDGPVEAFQCIAEVQRTSKDKAFWFCAELQMRVQRLCAALVSQGASGLPANQSFAWALQDAPMDGAAASPVKVQMCNLPPQTNTSCTDMTWSTCI